MRRLLLPALVLCGLVAPSAHAGVPFTVGEGRAPHVALGPADTAHVVWNDETGKVFHCRLPRGAGACDPLSTIETGTSDANPYALVTPDGAILIAMPHYVDEKTYLWRSTDDGRTWSPRQTIYNWGGGTDVTEPILGPQPGRITFAASNKMATVWSAAIDGSEADRADHATLSGTGDFDFQIAPTTDGGLVAVGNDQQVAAFHRMAPGTDPRDPASWSAPTKLPGQDDTTRVAGGSSGTYMLSTVGPTDAHMNLRRWTGSGFSAPVEEPDFGYINDIHVGPSGTVAAMWRTNDPDGNLLRLALSKDAGGSYELATIAQEDSVMSSMDVVLAGDDLGLAVYESAHPTNNARALIRAVNTSPIAAVSPNPPSVARKTLKVPGAKLRLDLPGNCVEENSSFNALVSAKKKRGSNRFRRIKRVQFFLGGARLKKDRKKPFAITVPTDDLEARQEYTLRAAVKVKLKGGKATRSISAIVQVC